MNYKPNEAMKKAAQRGLDLRRKYGRGGTAVGVARARDIINGKELPIQTVGRMFSFFARHRVDKQASGWSPSEDNYPSAGLVAWLIWGGDPGDKWSTQIWEKYKEDNKSLDIFESLFNEESSEEVIKSIIFANYEE